MNPEKTIADYLKTVPELVVLIADRVYWPQSPSTIAQAHLRVNEVDGGHLHNLPVSFPIVQVSAFSKNNLEARALKDIVVEKLKDARLVVDGAFVVSTLQADPGEFQAETWWNAPATFALKHKEA